MTGSVKNPERRCSELTFMENNHADFGNPLNYRSMKVEFTTPHRQFIFSSLNPAKPFSRRPSGNWCIILIVQEKKSPLGHFTAPEYYDDRWHAMVCRGGARVSHVVAMDDGTTWKIETCSRCHELVSATVINGPNGTIPNKMSE